MGEQDNQYPKSCPQYPPGAHVPDAHPGKLRREHILIVARAVDPSLHHFFGGSLSHGDILTPGVGAARFRPGPGFRDRLLRGDVIEDAITDIEHA